MGDESAGSILVVDDEPSMRQLLAGVLEGEGHTVATAADGAEALAAVEGTQFDLVIQDLKMPGMSGIELLQRIKEHDPGMLIIIITAFSSWDSAVEAMRLGAYDYIKKPFDTEMFRQVVARAIERKRSYVRMQDELSTGKKAGKSGLEETDFFDRLSVVGAGTFHISDMVGNSPKMQAVFDMVRRVAPTDTSILILGESGTGKELVARSIHFMSLRASEPFIPVNCGAFTESLLESELFGHVKGAFTGAVSDKKGLFEVADRGTFFLDEVGELAQATQVDLLRIMESREFIPVGGVEKKKIDVRFITATAQDLEILVDRGLFREDLFYRLNVIRIELPPLRERPDDIPLLAGHFLALYSRRTRKQVVSISDEAMRLLAEYDWPGNVRELENTIERAVALAESDAIMPADLGGAFGPGGARKRRSPSPPPVPGESFDLQKRLAEVEINYIREALDSCGWNQTQAAELLGVTYRQLRYKLEALGIERDKPS